MENAAQTIRKSYKFRINPSKSQIVKLETTLDLCRELYNAALQERRDAWRLERKSITCYDQINQLPEIKKIRVDLKQVHSQVLQDVLLKLDKAFIGFFNRVKRKEKVGFPRFKGQKHFDSFCYTQKGFSLIENKLSLSKIGKVKIKLSRQIIGNVKTCTIKREIDKWYVAFSIETTVQPLPKTGKQIGIDVGIENFATLSDCTHIKNSKFYESSHKQLRRGNRSVSRKKKGSNNWKKAVLKLRKIYQKIKNRRADFQHKLSTHLIKEFDVIAIEKLNIKGLARGYTAKQIYDAAWGDFFYKLRYKAENAGRKLIQVDAKNTSQLCLCGNQVKKTLAQRQHNCDACGLSIHRDIVSAQIILSRGQRELNLTYAAGQSVFDESVNN